MHAIPRTISSKTATEEYVARYTLFGAEGPPASPNSSAIVDDTAVVVVVLVTMCRSEKNQSPLREGSGRSCSTAKTKKGVAGGGSERGRDAMRTGDEFDCWLIGPRVGRVSKTTRRREAITRGRQTG